MSHTALEGHSPFIAVHKKVEYEKDVGTLVQRYDGLLIPEIGLSLLLLCHPSSQLYFHEHFDYWALAFGSSSCQGGIAQMA